MQRLLGVVLCVAVGALGVAQITYAASEFEEYKQQQLQGAQQAKDEFELYREQLLAAFEAYRKQTAKVWGKRNNIVPDKTNWVSYPGDLSNRSVVNFATGTVEVAVAVDADKHVSEADARKRLEQTLRQAIEQGADMRPMTELASKPVSKPVGESVLQGQVADDTGNKLDPAQLDQFTENLAATAHRTTVRGDDGKTRHVYQTQFRLVPDHIKQRAMQYQQHVDSHAARQQVPSALVFAVMETESMFNPTARSGAPAFGLMQLVPTSGAREAYRYLYNEDKIVTDTYLYNPENNIQLGAAYLNRLYHNQLAGITSPQTRLWASIAAYNTGPSNVFRTFAGKYSKSRFGSHAHWQQLALAEINKRTAEQVYAFMRANLPYPETREYVKKVRERMPKYQA